MDTESKDEVNRLSPIIFCCHNKSGETSRYGCLEDGSPDTILLHHGTNDRSSQESAEKIASNINVALSAKNKKTLFRFQD